MGRVLAWSPEVDLQPGINKELWHSTRISTLGPWWQKDEKFKIALSNIGISTFEELV